MKRARFLNFVLASLLGVMTATPGTTLADDTEIYLGAQSQQSSILPNVLFILDTSGSMSTTVEGTGKDRLDNMKEALFQILDQANNINVGLMRFTDPGGPVLWPISFINEDVEEVVPPASEAGLDVNVRIDTSEDDAVQAITGPAAGTVTLSGTELELIQIALLGGSGSPVSFDRTIQSQSDNAEENSSGDIITQNQIDMDSNQTNAVRFRNITIPPGALVTDARVTFESAASDSSSITMRIQGEDTDNASNFPLDGQANGSFNVSSRPRTAEFVDWSPNPWSSGEQGSDTRTPDLDDIVQEIVCRGVTPVAGSPCEPYGPLGVPIPGNWSSGNAIVIILNRSHNPPNTTPGSGGGHRAAKTFQGAGGDPFDVAELDITYEVVTAAGNQEHLVGLRFKDVGIPQGATVTNAVLEFMPTEAPQSNDVTVNIFAEKVGDAPVFTTAANSLSTRFNANRTTNFAIWNQTDDWNDLDVVQQTVPITAVVQEVVSQGAWCGNNSLVLFLQKTAAGAVGPLLAESFDGDPSRAPILRVDFDENSVAPSACINSILQLQIFDSEGDAEETIGGRSNGVVTLTGSQLDMISAQVNGLHFPNVQIAQGSTVLEASLEFTAREVDTGAVTFTFRTQAIDNALPFVSSSFDVSGRSVGGSSASWSAPDFDTVGVAHTAPGLAPIIQEVINRPGWEAGNGLAIIQRHSAGGQRRARTFNDAPIDAPRLRIRVQGAQATSVKTVRTQLKEIVDDLDHAGFTPIVDVLYEGARYLRGDAVDWGKQRGFANGGSSTEGTSSFASGDPSCDANGDCNDRGSTNNTVRQNTRISHPSSWTGGVVNRPTGCTDANLNSPDCRRTSLCTAGNQNSAECRGEFVSGSPVYVSPYQEACQASYIVLLTDGEANHNDSIDRIQSHFGLTCDSNDSTDERCGRELAEHLFEDDQVDSLPGNQLITTYTIGFNLENNQTAVTFMKDLAKEGGGQFFEATTAADLANVFQAILTDILSRSTSFATPSLSVNAFNKLFDLDSVYFALFIPDTRARWSGNVKHFKICEDTSQCNFGEILDADGVSAIQASDQRIKETARSVWSSGPDGADIELGGAAENLPSHASRQVYTFTDLASPLVNPVNEDLSLTVNLVKDDNADGILDGLVGHPDHPDPLADTRVLLGDPTGLLTQQERAELIAWIRGQDVDDEDEDDSTTDTRFVFADPLHSSPVAITYGGTEANPVIKLFVGTNDGVFRMVNAVNGIEQWAVIPQSELRKQDDLRINPNGNHVYGMDGLPSPWIFDADNDGVIEPPTDFVRVIIGQRRGGTRIFAFDVTPTSALIDPTSITDITPTLMWRIDGGSGDFPNLGQTWSRPIVAKMRFGTPDAGESEIKDVLVFAGGYDDAQDNGVFGPTGNTGNAIYVVDALTGELLFTLSSDDPGTGDRQVVASMECPIPSDVALFDSDGDGADDRLYVGDLCGQVHRVDFSPDLSASPGLEVVHGVFATLSDEIEAEDHRKIFFRPSIVQVLNTQFTTTARYDLVTLVTGWRDHPLGLDAQDNAYALRDFHVEPLTDNDDDGLADFGTYTTIEGPIVGAPGTMFDATDVVNATELEESDFTEFQNSSGWFIRFEDTGEKGLAAPIILSGKLFFTTFLPQGVVALETCAVSEGAGRLYGVDALTGGAILNFDDSDGTQNLTVSDKKYALGSGIPSSAVPIFQEPGVTLLIGGGGGATTVNPDIGIPRGQRYWYEQ